MEESGRQGAEAVQQVQGDAKQGEGVVIHGQLGEIKTGFGPFFVQQLHPIGHVQRFVKPIRAKGQAGPLRIRSLLNEKQEILLFCLPIQLIG